VRTTALRPLPRTIPFRLEELVPHPAGFSEARFSPTSELRRWGELAIEIIREPAATLGEALPLVYAELLRITATATPYHPGTYMFRHLDQASTLVVVRKAGKPEGFSIGTLRELDGAVYLFFNATMYTPAIQGAGLGLRVNLIHLWQAVRRARGRPFYAAVRTQNPIALATVIAGAPFYPRPGKVTPSRLRQAAAKLAAVLNPGACFDAEAMVQRGVLARDAREPGRPRHHDPRLNAFCDRHLDYEAGDLFLLMARLSAPAVLGTELFCRWRRRRRS
jgi:hypothetical protein